LIRTVVANQICHQCDLDTWHPVQSGTNRLSESLRLQAMMCEIGRRVEGFDVPNILLVELARDSLRDEFEVLILAQVSILPRPRFEKMWEIPILEPGLKVLEFPYGRISSVFLDQLPQCCMRDRTLKMEVKFNLWNVLEPVHRHPQWSTQPTVNSHLSGSGCILPVARHQRLTFPQLA